MRSGRHDPAVPASPAMREVGSLFAGRPDAPTPYLVREPIVTVDRALVGYDLQVRQARPPGAKAGSGAERATDELIESGFYGIGLESVAGSATAFLNVGEALLLSERIETLPAADVVLTLERPLASTAAVAKRIRDLRALGYRFALSDDDQPDRDALGLVDAMSILRLGHARIGELSREVRRHVAAQPGLQLMARGACAPAEVEAARRAGAELFEGYHFLNAAAARRASASDQALLLKMLKLLRDDAQSSVIVEELKRQPALSVATLRAANASSNALLRRSIDSLQDALAMMGRDRLGRLVQMLVYADPLQGDVQHDPLLQLAVARAKLLEDLAGFDPTATTEERRAAFVVGLLSLIELALGLPLPEVLKELRYDGILAGALLERTGKLGQLLALAECMEQADDEGVARLLDDLPGMHGDALIQIQLGSLAWLRHSGVS